MLSLFLASFALGVAFCAPPGAVTAEAIRRGIAHGFRSVLYLELGSLIGDAVWASIALIGVAFLTQNPIVRVVLGLLGAALLFRLAWDALRAAQSGKLPHAQPASHRNSFAAGAALSLSNPTSVAFWLGVGSGFIGGASGISPAVQVTTFFAGFMAACVAWCFFFAGLVAVGRRLLTPPFFRAINLLCGTMLAGLAVLLLVRLGSLII